MMFQSILVPKATFWRPRFRICRPPLRQGLVTVSQLTKWSFFSLCFPPFQRKFLSRDQMQSRTPLGASRMEHWYIGILDKKSLIRTTFHGGFNQLAPQVLILLLILSIIGSQEEDFRAYLKMGTPRYLKSSHWVFPLILRILLMSTRSLGLQFQLRIWLLLQLMRLLEVP